MFSPSRREVLRAIGVSPVLWPLLNNLPAFANAGPAAARKQRLVILFSPNGTVVDRFWPPIEEGKNEAPLELPPILKPLEPFRDQTLVLRGLDNKVQGDGDGHMRGIGCLLTGIELFPGNIQGGSHTPAGWSSGHSIDQEIRRYLQQNPATRTRFGSLELGVAVPDRADTWTRMVYAGPNQPISPIDNPYQLFSKLYGGAEDREAISSVLDGLRDDFRKVESLVGDQDRHLLRQHADFVRSMEQQIAADEQAGELEHPIPELEPGIRERDDNIPKISRMQIELLASAFAADFARVATLQFTNSVSNARMRWLGIEEGHHTLSHRPDKDEKSQEQLTRINTWYAEQVAMLAQRLADTPEPGGEGSLLDNTTIVWTNELGKGNSHTHDDTPFVLIGGGLGFTGGRAIDYGGQPHHRLLMALAGGFGHALSRFGNADFCGNGPLSL